MMRPRILRSTCLTRTLNHHAQRRQMHNGQQQQQTVTHNKEMRKAVWLNTHELISQGYYIPSLAATRCDLKVTLDGIEKLKGGIENRRQWKPSDMKRFDSHAEIVVMKGDCLQASIELTKKGLHPMVMNAGSGGHFGGGYKNGARAQEEELCRRTTLAFAMCKTLGKQTNAFYPLAHGDGIYVPDVKIFRDVAAEHYQCLPQPIPCGIGIVSAFNRPPLCTTVDDVRIKQPHVAQATEELIRTFFQMGFEKEHDAVVAVPIGCGAYRNPATHIAEMMMAVAEEYKYAFKTIAFSIIDDHNASHPFNPLGNFLPFALRAAHHPNGKVFTDIHRTAEIDVSELEAQKVALLEQWKPQEWNQNIHGRKAHRKKKVKNNKPAAV